LIEKIRKKATNKQKTKKTNKKQKKQKKQKKKQKKLLFLGGSTGFSCLCSCSEGLLATWPSAAITKVKGDPETCSNTSSPFSPANPIATVNL
jgi:UDP-N-acetylglucosamine:LPS N-acetylglucosamine transferase